MLTAKSETSAYVEAADAERGLAYRCRGCGESVVLKAGQLRIAHFAHRPGVACVFGAAMSLAHLTLQRKIAEALRARGVNAKLEAVLPGLDGARRIDVLAWPNERPSAQVAIEVQASDQTLETIAARTQNYGRAGVAPVWLRLLDFGAFQRVQTLAHRGTIWIERYRPSAWERWAHDHLGGRLWFVDEGTFLAWRGLFVPAHSRRDGRLQISTDDSAPGVAGEWTEIIQWVDLELEGPFSLDDLRLSRTAFHGPDDVSRLGAALTPVSDRVVAPVPPGVRVVFRPERWGRSRWLEVEAQGRWVPALIEGARSDWRTHRPPALDVAWVQDAASASVAGPAQGP